MSESVTLKSYFYEVLIPSSQKNTSSPIEDILHHVSISFMKKLALYKCFNPRTHTGCDLGNTHKRFGYCVSIHAPTRGATKPKTFRYFVPRGFNPRTHTGCDIIYVQGHDLHVCFNPRTHTGCDLRISRHRPSTVLSFQSTHPHGVRRYVIRRILRRAVVSIHAPTRGATAY